MNLRPAHAVIAAPLIMFAVLLWDRWLFWAILLAVAVMAAPWFAAARLLDRIAELEADNGRLSRELDAERTVRRQTEHAFAELSLSLEDKGTVLPLRPVRQIPEQRTATHDHLAEDDAWFDRLYDDKGDLR